jgi:hypothetical protein
MGINHHCAFVEGFLLQVILLGLRLFKIAVEILMLVNIVNG